MKKTRFTDEQIVAALRDADATSAGEAARKHGVSEQSIHRWRKQYAGMAVSDVRELKSKEPDRSRAKDEDAVSKLWRAASDRMKGDRRGLDHGGVIR